MRLFLTALYFLFFAQAIAQSDREMVEMTTSKDDIFAHMSFLASDALLGRDINTQGGRVAAEYIKSQMLRYGVKAAPGMNGEYFQPVGLKKVTSPKSGTVRIAGKELTYGREFIMVDGNNATIEGRFVFVNHASRKDLEKQKNLKGKILVAFCGDGEDGTPAGWFTVAPDKRALAKEFGAAGLVEIYQNAQLPWSMLTGYVNQNTGGTLRFDEGGKESDFQHVWIGTEDKELVKALRKGKGKRKHTASVSIAGIETEAFTTPNVVGVLEGSDPKLKNEYVIYSAHYDHVGVGRADEKGDTIYNGARDNAIGTTAVIEAMEHFSKYPTRRSALFILFTAEEKGLLGSKWFAKHPPFPLKDISYCFNIDGAGYNDTSLVTVFGLGRTTAGKHMSAACETFGLKAIDDPAPEQNLFDRSDNVSFAEKGIPAPTFSQGFTAFDEEIFKYYHQPGDEVDSMDFDYLLKYVRSFLLSGRLIANDDAKPFWTEGDKYYDAGVKLYGK